MLRPPKLEQVASPGALNQVASPEALKQVKLVASELRASPRKNEASCFGASRFAPYK